MRHTPRIVFALFIILVATCAQPAQRVHAASNVTFTVTIGGAFLRANPALTEPTTQPVFADQTFAIVAKSADAAWVQLGKVPKAGDGAWLLTVFGTVNGDLSTVPVVAFTPDVKQADWTDLPAWIPTITPFMRSTYHMGRWLGKDTGLFTVIGDCNSESTAYLGRLAAGTFTLPEGSEYLQATVEHFSASFPRYSLATHGSFGAEAMFDSTWTDPNLCGDDGPLGCELKLSRASIAFIALGTGDQYTWRDFEKNYRAVIEYTLNANVLPVLVTKADDLETHSKAPSGTINGIIRALGAEYGVPVMDFYVATRGLPGYGLRNEGNDNFHMTPAGSDARILATLQTLYALTR
ncbi:MAG TPA: SGNH/GDSL hydrolase family protein [Anaerolineae bacterium]|jgi:hypothetical protein